MKDTHELIFTSGCTEANNLALSNFPEVKKICSCIEHPAVINVIGEGIIPVDNNGIVNVDYIENYLVENNTKKLLISVMYANNEIGTIQPIQQIAKLAEKYDFIFQLRLDFSTFVITGPSTSTFSTGTNAGGSTNLGGSNTSPATQCLTDTFSVTGSAGSNPPAICGTNTGYHSKFFLS